MNIFNCAFFQLHYCDMRLVINEMIEKNSIKEHQKLEKVTKKIMKTCSINSEKRSFKNKSNENYNKNHFDKATSLH